ncbi:MAG: winged helix-turn-helix domain-containing protein [Candidatus Bathyarchaeia archaeon]
MSISPVKRLILEAMWVSERPVKVTEITKEVGLGFRSVWMHIMQLARLGYVQSMEDGSYKLTEKGRKALGFPEIDNAKAAEILAYLPLEKSFHFYVDVGRPLNIHAASLNDFCDKLLKVNLESIEFHTNRGDFEAWFTGLGDVELARKVFLLKEQKLFGEDLRKRLYEIVKNRCEELANIRKKEAGAKHT